MSSPSEATFGTGTGSPGIDAETARDPKTGLPRIPGVSLLQLAAEATADFALRPAWGGGRGTRPRRACSAGRARWIRGALGVAEWATLPQPIVDEVRYQTALYPLGGDVHKHEGYSPDEVFEAWTAVRRQTAIGPDGTAQRASLRTLRVVLRGTPFHLPVTLVGSRSEYEYALLSAALATVHRGGARPYTRARTFCRPPVIPGRKRCAS